MSSTPINRPKIFAWIAAAIIFFAALTIVEVRAWPTDLVMGDYRAFYCGARVAFDRQNPYERTPLAACESAPTRKPLYRTSPGQILPAPIPGYVAAALIPLAILPFEYSALIWTLLLIAAGFTALGILVRLGAGTFPVLLIVFAIPLFSNSFAVGELPPLALLGVSLVALALAGEKTRWLVPGLALAMVEPQVGICVAAALCALRRTYWPYVAATLLGLAVVSVATVGFSANVQYVRDVLPAHLYAELPGIQQYSLSWALDRLGFMPTVSLALGKLWYVAMIVAAVTLARAPIARRSPEFVPFAAAAFAVTLGPFVHLDHIALALPAALWLASRAKRPSFVLVAAIVALGIPMLYILGTPWLILPVPLIAAWIGNHYGRSRDAGLRTAAVATVLLVAIEALAVHTGTGLHVLGSAQPVSVGTQDEWARFIRQHEVMTAWSFWIVKLPTWYGVLATFAACLLSIRPQGQTPIEVRHPQAGRSN